MSKVPFTQELGPAMSSPPCCWGPRGAKVSQGGPWSRWLAGCVFCNIQASTEVLQVLTFCRLDSVQNKETWQRPPCTHTHTFVYLCVGQPVHCFDLHKCWMDGYSRGMSPRDASTSVWTSLKCLNCCRGYHNIW